MTCAILFTRSGSSFLHVFFHCHQWILSIKFTKTPVPSFLFLLLLLWFSRDCSQNWHQWCQQMGPCAPPALSNQTLLLQVVTSEPLVMFEQTWNSSSILFYVCLCVFMWFYFLLFIFIFSYFLAILDYFILFVFICYYLQLCCATIGLPWLSSLQLDSLLA